MGEGSWGPGLGLGGVLRGRGGVAGVFLFQGFGEEAVEVGGGGVEGQGAAVPLFGLRVALLVEGGEAAVGDGRGEMGVEGDGAVEGELGGGGVGLVELGQAEDEPEAGGGGAAVDGSLHTEFGGFGGVGVEEQHAVAELEVVVRGVEFEGAAEGVYGVVHVGGLLVDLGENGIEVRGLDALGEGELEGAAGFGRVLAR